MEEEKIRQRTSYRNFKAIYKEISACCMDNKQDATKVLLLIHSIIDNYRGFKSIKNSDYAKESVTQVIKDLDLSEQAEAKTELQEKIDKAMKEQKFDFEAEHYSNGTETRLYTNGNDLIRVEIAYDQYQEYLEEIKEEI